MEYLCAAAENGKEVTAVIELRARFDEQNNIDWSERLEDAGCRVIYGFSDYKIHSKVCLITLKGKSGIQYVTQIGTGNYNEKTSEQYTDPVSYTHLDVYKRQALAGWRTTSLTPYPAGFPAGVSYLFAVVLERER